MVDRLDRTVSRDSEPSSRTALIGEQPSLFPKAGPLGLVPTDRRLELAITGVKVWRIMFGFLLQWPTFITLIMFPIMVTVYIRLAHREEAEVRAEFGRTWYDYAARTPGFIPRLWRPGGNLPEAPRGAHV